jgi:cupin fold WbuC family metalloprotein
MSSLQQVDNAKIDSLLAEARAAPRGRKNYNYHERTDHPCQRLLNAILPGSYVRPHRHVHADKDEFMIVVRGCLGVVFYDASGAVTGTMKLEAGGPVFAVSIPVGMWHTAIALAPTVIFEAKGGPYTPLNAEELAPFAPAEGAADSPAYLRRMEALFADA